MSAPGWGCTFPATAIDAQQVQTGLIVATGPGTPVADLSTLDDEPWKIDAREGRSRGMQARVGDHAIFFRKAVRGDHLRGAEVPGGATGRYPGAGSRRFADLVVVSP